MVLNDIIDQVSERPQSKATHFSSAYQVGYFPIKHSPIWLLLCCRTTMTRDPRWRTLCSTASREPRTWCVSGIVAGCGSGLQRYTHTTHKCIWNKCQQILLLTCSVCVLLMRCIYIYIYWCCTLRCYQSLCSTPSPSCSSRCVSWSMCCSWVRTTTTWSTTECEYYSLPAQDQILSESSRIWPNH